MNVKELRCALTKANLLMPEEHCTGVYQERDRRRTAHLISLGRWATSRCEDLCLDSQLDVDQLYGVLADHLQFDCARFKSLLAIMEAIDDAPELACPPLDASDERLEAYSESITATLSALLAAEPWLEGAPADLFPEEPVISPEPPIPTEDSP